MFKNFKIMLHGLQRFPSHLHCTSKIVIDSSMQIVSINMMQYDLCSVNVCLKFTPQFHIAQFWLVRISMFVSFC